ncbi:hypothetical protein [Flavobacterium sp.]|uniref:hypothetical protein n=1 Tax=Flavobacterium sp. TaxID=239 RepID=UPI003BEECBCA
MRLKDIQYLKMKTLEFMKIFDCFTYFNEQDMLRIRLEELGDVVDYFVVVEASQTFTGISKPFYFDNLPGWINKWKEKIIRVKIDFPTEANSSWLKEYYQRNAIAEGLTLAKSKDLIMISDADEIVNANIFKSKVNTPTRLDVKQYFWNFHWQAPAHCNQGARPVIVRKKHLDISCAQELRASNLPLVPNAGWHFSFFGEPEKIKNKIESFAHTEYNLDEYKNNQAILYRIENGIDPFDRFPLKYYEIDKSYPKFVQSMLY